MKKNYPVSRPRILVLALLSLLGSSAFSQNCPTPTGLFTSTVTSSFAFLYWLAPAPPNNIEKYYNYRYRQVGSGTWTTYQYQGNLSTSPYDSILIQPLNASTEYEWQVQAVYDSTDGYACYSLFSPSSTFTTAAGCNPPFEFADTDITTNSGTILWDAVPNAISYVYQFQQLFNGYTDSIPTIGATTATSLSFTGLNPSTTYLLSVESVCGAGDTSPVSPYYYNGWVIGGGGDDLTTLDACNAPANPTTTDVTNYSATFVWNSVPGATSYSYWYFYYVSCYSYYCDCWGQCNTYYYGPYTTTDTAVTVRNLNPTTNGYDLYQWQVETNCSAGTSTSVGAYFMTHAPCNSIGNTSTSNITSTTASLNWDTAQGASGYTYQYSPLGNNSWITGSTAVSPVVISGLTSGTTYQWQVQTNCSNGTSTFVPGPNFSTLGLPCGVPGGLTSSNVTGSTATFTWNADSGSTAYNVRYRVVGSVNWTVTSSNNNTLNVTGLSAGSNYEWQVQSTCSAYSASADFTTYCNNPTNPQVIHVTNNSVTFNWTPAAGVSQYIVQYNVYGNSGWITGTTSADSFNVTGLTASTEYVWQVYSACKADSSGTVGSNFSTSCGYPQLTYYDPTNANIIFYWDPVPGATGYNMQYKVYNAANYISLGSTTADSFNLSPASAGTSFDFEVRSVCPQGTSAWAFTEGDTYAFPAPSGETTQNIGLTSATLKWLPVQGATEYFVEFFGNLTVNGQQYDDYYFTSNTDSLNVTGLITGESYSWSVAVHEPNYSAPSPVIYFNTSCGVPVTTPYVDGAEFGINWSEVSGAYEYNFRYELLGDSVWQTLLNVYNGQSETEYLSGQTYRAEVQSVCSYPVTSLWSAPDTFVTPCAEPYTSDPTNVTSTSAVLHWQNISGYDTVYLDYYYVYGADSFPTIYKTVGGDSLLITGLLPNNTYGWNVRTKCEVGISPYTNPIWFRTSYPDTVKIVASPGSIICTGTNVQFTATATDGGYSPTYNWLLNGVSVQNGSSNTYSNAGLHNGDSVTCMVTALTNELYATTATSNSIHITVSNYVTPAISIISSLPSKICTGELGTFRATATNQGISPVYTWKIDGVTVQSGSSSVYSKLFESNTIYGNNFRISCVLTSSAPCASPTTATSDTILLTLQGKPVKPTIQGQSKGVCGGSTWKYTCNPIVGATQYLWAVPKGCTVDSGQFTTSVIVTFPANYDSAQIEVEAHNTCGNSAPAYLTVKCSTRAEDETETGEEEIPVTGDIKLNVYPNPNNGQMYIDLEQSEAAPVSYRVFNLMGQMVHEYSSVEPVASFQQSLDLGSQPSGIYFIQIRAGEAVLSRSIVVTK